MIFQRLLSLPNIPVENQVKWKIASSKITDNDGKIIFEMENIEVPEHWSQNAINTIAQKYFRKAGVPDLTIQNNNIQEPDIPIWLRASQPSGTGIFGSETSAKQVFHRLAGAWTYWGWKEGIFYNSIKGPPDVVQNEENARIFYDELYLILALQLAAPNSPQWFNTGLHWAYGISGNENGQWANDLEGNPFLTSNSYEYPQPHACFIQPITDNLVNPGGIMDLWVKEARLFKQGSGTGTNFSKIRGKGEKLSGGGKSSGLMSFLKIGDVTAGSIASGGTCLAPDQYIYTEIGPRTVKELAELNEDFIVLSYDPPAKRYKAKKAHAWKSGQKKLVLIKTDKGSFKLSEDHPILLEGNIGYTKAIDLKPNQSIFACTIDDQNGYLRVGLHDGNKGKEFWHRLIAKDVLNWEIKGNTVHHKKENDKYNCHPDNLELLSQNEHAYIHGKALANKGEHIFQKQKFDHSGSNNGMNRDSNFYKDQIKVDKYKLKQSNILHSRGDAKSMQEIAASQKILNMVFKVQNLGGIVSTLENYITHREFLIGKIGDKRKVRQSIIDRFGTWENLLSEMNQRNHKVISIEILEISDVYDVEVECPTIDDKSVNSGHNFVIWSNDSFLGSGIVVSNTRRAAKMVCLDLDHPEIEEFVAWKTREERKARALVLGSKMLNDGGEIYSDTFEGEAINTVSGQNANNSVRPTNAFFKAVDDNLDWNLINRTDGKIYKTIKANDLWEKICLYAWLSGDPGLQFHDHINEWHTCKSDGLINASNPCCFVGETYVDTSEGKIQFSKLEEMYRTGQKLPLAFGFDLNDRMPILSQIKRVWIAGQAKELVRVITDKGIEFTCTPEHRILTRYGKIEAGIWVEARNLKPGMRLRKIGRLINALRNDRCTISTRKGDFYQNRFIWEQINGQIPPGFDVHHKDENPMNDSFSNFELKETTAHLSHHFSGDRNPKWIDVDISILVEIFEELEKFRTTRTNGHDGAHYINWNSYIRKNGLAGKVPLANTGTGRIRGMEWEDFCEFLNQNRGEVNHRIISVELFKPDIPVKVYDLEVSNNHHNFGITNFDDHGGDSIIVHNSEYMFLDDTACNLASLNLIKFLDKSGELDIKKFIHVTNLMTIVLEISVFMASFPSKEIARNSYLYRTLGLGYANLGAYLMQKAIPYDSDGGRNLAGSITALLHMQSYRTSNILAKELGAFERYEANRDSMNYVLTMHLNAAFQLAVQDNNQIIKKAVKIYEELEFEYGFRNAQVTLIAPTGTISLVMDCDMTGIEPDFSLIKFKALSGGGNIQIINQSIEIALQRLGYKPHQINLMLAHIQKEGNLENFKINNENLPEEHLKVFDCANKCGNGQRYLRPEAHILMMAAVQPFLSGAISKTCNLPHEATIDDVKRIYRMANDLKLKAVAIYRDGSKLTQPLTSQDTKLKENIEENNKRNFKLTLTKEQCMELAKKEEGYSIGAGFETITSLSSTRRRLPHKSRGYTQDARIDGQKLYLHTSEYENGELGAIFMELSREGSTVRALMNCIGIAVSIGLQFGVPLNKFVDAFVYRKFEPAGIVEGHAEIKMCHSVIDFIFRDLAIHYLNQKEFSNVDQFTPQPIDSNSEGIVDVNRFSKIVEEAKTTAELIYSSGVVFNTGNICPNCHHATLTIQGTCVKCTTCNYDTGCG